MSSSSQGTATWRFTRRSLVAAARVLEADLTHAHFTSFLVDLGQGLARRVLRPQVSLKKRVNVFIVLLDAEPATRDHAGNLVADAVVEYAVKIMPEPVYGWGKPPESLVHHAGLLCALDQDGFRVVDNAIHRALSPE